MKALTSIRRRWAAVAWIASAAVMTSCGQQHEEPGPSAIGQHREAATAAAVPSSTQVKLNFPAGSDLLNTAISAQTELLVRDGVIVTSNAPAFVVNSGTGLTEVGLDAVLGSGPINLTAGGNVSMKDRSRLTGSLVAGGSLSKGSNVVISGSTSVNQTIPWATQTLPLTLALSETPVQLQAGQQKNLDPGGYGNVVLNGSARLRLKSGTYTFKSLDAQSTSIIELTNSGPVVIQVREKVTYRGKVEGTSAASRLLLIGVGTQEWWIDAPFKGTIVHPLGRVLMSPVNGTGHQGAVHAKRMELGARNPISFVPFGHWTTVFTPRLVSACLASASADNLVASFTVDNPMAVSVPPGPKNSITPAQPEESSTIWAGPGTQQRVLSSSGEPISWTVGDQTLTVSNDSPPCAATSACQAGVVSCEASSANRHSEITLTNAAGVFVGELDIRFSEGDFAYFEREFKVTKNGVVTFAQTSRRTSEGALETLVTWNSAQGTSSFVGETTPGGGVEGTINGSPFGPQSLGASGLPPFNSGQPKYDADTQAVLGCLLQRLAAAALSCEPGGNSALAAASAGAVGTDGGHLSETYNADPCQNCKITASAGTATAAIACTVASLGWGAALCWIGALGTEYGLIQICLHSDACCPEACGAEVPGMCCFSDESCLDKNHGLCCPAGKAPCGDIDHGTSCCSADQQCLDTEGSKLYGTCCDTEDACGGNCCKDPDGVTVFPHGHLICLDPYTSKCCHEDLVCGTQCCSSNDNCISGECVPREGCDPCAEVTDCVSINPAYNWCYKERDAATGCCGAMVK